jgi:hypothetical protein
MGTGSKRRARFRPKQKPVGTVPITTKRRKPRMEKDKPVGPTPPAGPTPPPKEGQRESPLGPGEHQKEEPTPHEPPKKAE